MVGEINCPGNPLSDHQPTKPRRSNEKCHWRPPPSINRITTEPGALLFCSLYISATVMSFLIYSFPPPAPRERTPLPYELTEHPVRRKCVPSRALSFELLVWSWYYVIAVIHPECYIYIYRGCCPGKNQRDYKLFTATSQAIVICLALHRSVHGY